MKSKLLKLLYEYSASGKLVDGKYIQELIEIVVDSKDIVDYAGGLIITDKDSRLRDPNSLLAVYYPNRKLIAVYLDAIEEMLKSYNTYQEMFSSTEELFYKNLLVTQVVLHELEHANQRKIMDKEESLEGDKVIEIKKGDRFVQGIFIPYLVTDDDVTTDLRKGGIGSTNDKGDDL